jgi:hypothetical protein
VGENVLVLIEHINAPAAHVIGTSFAAAPAVWAAARQSGCILSLVLIGAVVRSEKMNPFMQALLWILLNNPWKVQNWLMYYRKDVGVRSGLRELLRTTLVTMHPCLCH